MVDINQIEQELQNSFTIKGTYEIMPNLTVNVTGDVKHTAKQKKLKVKFHTVTGTFDSLWRGLTDLCGLPDHAQHTWITYYPQQKNLLRVLAGKRVSLQSAAYKDYFKTDQDRRNIQIILDKYKNMGKAGILKAAVDMIQAGYKDQAKW